jgi:hypothetical protein
VTDATGRTVVLTERVPAPALSASGRRTLAAVVLAHLLLVAAVLADGPELLLVVTLLLCAAAEVPGPRRAPFGWWALARTGLGPVARMSLRSVVVLVAMSTAGLGADRVAQVLVLIGLVAVPLSLVAVNGLGDLVRRARHVPVSARGFALGLEIPPAPRAWVGRVSGWPLDVVVSVPAVLFVSLFGPPVEIIVLTLVVVVALAPSGLAIRALLRTLRPARRLGSGRMTTAIEDALEQDRPEVALYFAGPAEALYQLTMWLPTFERLATAAPARRTVVVLRDPEAMLAMPPTSLPVVCVERGNALLQLHWPTSLRLACYVGNAAGNIHFLRERRFRHVFIGHGDSDKTVSTGRYAKVYDEIWTAGPAGRERWRAAGVGVDDAAIVEVGAPFAEVVRADPAPVTPTATASAAKPTVVYAPTWEGVADGADTTSVGPCGEAMIRRLLDLDVRVVYRPHPLTGTRDPRIAAAHTRILRMLGLAEPARTVRRATDAAAPVDVLDVAGLRDIASAESTNTRARDRTAALLSGSAHVYAPAGELPLDAVLRAADAAVTDISAALSALLATGIPVAVTDPAGLPPAAFQKRYPSTANAYLVGPDGAGIDQLVAAVRGADPLAPDRERARDLLFGPPDPSSDRFVAAVDGALRRAGAYAGTGPDPGAG